MACLAESNGTRQLLKGIGPVHSRVQDPEDTYTAFDLAKENPVTMCAAPFAVRNGNFDQFD